MINDQVGPITRMRPAGLQTQLRGIPRGLPGTIFGAGELHSRRINHFHADNLAVSEMAVSPPQLAISQTTSSKNQPNQPQENSHGNRHGCLSLICRLFRS
jgi:hypothetical protein